MPGLTNNDQLQAAQILKTGATLGLTKIDSSDAAFYNAIKTEAKIQQNEMSQFNEVDQDQLMFVVQL